MSLDTLRAQAARLVPGRVRAALVKKDRAEMSYWRSRFEAEGGRFENGHYRRLMLAMAGESTEEFLAGKTVADFGCGPRGSLVWAGTAAVRIGVDVLVDRYAEEFKTELVSHGMIYVKSTEHLIPLPSNSVDVMFTLNAMDHVDRFSEMASEVLRVIKPGGLLIGSFNLEEPPTPTEPQRLTEQGIRESLLDQMEIHAYRVTRKAAKHGNAYAPFFEDRLSYESGEEGYLWVRAQKPQEDR